MPRSDALHVLRGGAIRFVKAALPGRVRRALVGSAIGIGRATLRQPRLKTLAKLVLSRFPALRARIQAGLYRASLASASRLSNRLRDDADLSPRTVRMLRALKLAARRTPPP